MNQKHNFYWVGRGLYQEDRIFFALIEKKYKELQDTAVRDTGLINTYFRFFCELNKIEPDEIRVVTPRITAALVATRRLFIAIILKVYDPIYLAGYTPKMADKLRKSISDALNCHEVWVSNVAPSVKVELNKLKGYNKTVEELITAINEAMQSETADIPVYVNSGIQ